MLLEYSFQHLFYFLTITILHIIHRPILYLKYDASETGFGLRLLVEHTQLGPIDRASLCLRTAATTSVVLIYSLKPCVLNERQDNGQCAEL
jgi:hypothetical protein